ncbi:MAG: efflux RND transporter periplasmic adaptor subunit [Verrucomicrobia bacterium]|nr:efflux RND transporter periplasmic adaptor subunit [Verrucomicrobiota bacterium]
MHPTYVSDRPGDCPICNMKLVLIREDQPAMAPPADSAPHVQAGQYYCPMDENVVSNAPGVCPECNMKLILRKEASPAHEGHGESATPAPVPGRISIRLSPEKRQLIGLTLSTVEKRSLTRTVRSTGTVEHDETRYARIAPRFAGWVRELHVNFTGAPIEKGQPLFTVYSPELFASESEYLVAWRAAQQLKTNAPASQRDAAIALLESARLRLTLYQVGEEEIRALEQRGQASAELPFRAPFSGHVLVKNAIEGQSFMAGQTLYEIADLSRLWLRASVVESDFPRVAIGQNATSRFPYLTPDTYAAQVTFIYPHIDPQTRRGEVRLELENPEHRIRPGMWADVELEIESGEKLAVPASAVINTGTRYVAFAEGPDQHLEPREVSLGWRTDDYYEVVAGLREGEQVVTRALFLVDSESQLKAAIAGMGAAGEHQH